jgi:nickel-dependent lactate racemase
MATIDLKYGRTSLPIHFDEKAFEPLEPKAPDKALGDAEIGHFLDRPIDSPCLEEIVNAGDTVLLVVPDATRQSGCGQVVNLVVRRLIANGSPPGNIGIIFATGIHRPVNAAERSELLTPFIAQRIKIFDHDAYDPIRNFRVGGTSHGIPVELDWRLTEFDHVVIIGSVTFHYFAGFTGGRKLICPGLASSKTIEATHKLAFDCETLERRRGVGTGLLDGNPVHEAFLKAASHTPVAFSVSTIVNDAGEVTSLFCGDWISSHRRACSEFASANALAIPEKRQVVVASCGGYPMDINLIQAHKALEAAAMACRDGGTMILIAHCEDGLGRNDFLKWFDAADSRQLAIDVCKSYQVNGQTAWSLLTKAERFNVCIVTSLDNETLTRMRLKKMEPEEISDILSGREGYIIPNSSKLNISIG